MADNTVLNAGSGGDTIRDVQKGSVKTPVCIIDVGGAGSESLLTAGQANMAASVPVVIASNQSAVPVTVGAVTANAGTNLNTSLLALETGGNLATIAGKDFATQTTLAALNAKVTACNTGAVVISGALPAGTNNIGNVGLAPQTSGGLSVGRVVSAASTNATSVKASAGQFYGYAAFNTNAAWRYLKIYDKGSAPTVGSDTPLLTIGLPPGGGANMAFPNGVQCSAGIALALTTGMADNDTGAVGAADVAVNVTYK